MKKLFLLPLLVGLTLFASAQTNPNLIDFEPSTANLNGCGNYAQAEYATVDNVYFQCAYGVTFHMNGLGGPPPIIGQVGAPTVGWITGSSVGAYNNANCSVSAGVNSDKPSSNKDIGCFFLTDSNPGTGKNPDPLYVDYHNLGCTQASGYLMDVDGSGTEQEGWKVTTVGTAGTTVIGYVLSPTYSSYATPPTPQLNTVGGDGIASEWAVNLGTEPIDYISFEYIGNPNRGVGIAFDEFSICSNTPAEVPATGCCDDMDMDNLIPNGSFESGNIGFNSGYTYQSTIAPNSVIRGQYTVATGNQAATISNCWDISDHTNCSSSGKMLLINGQTEQAGAKIAYQQIDIPVEVGEPYIFCMYYQHLPQCAFDAFDPSNIDVIFNGSEDVTLSDCESDDDHCGWTKVAYTVIPNNTTLSIDVLLNETVIGDGNDVAFDDFSLRKKADMPSEYCDFYVDMIDDGNYFQVTATALTSPLPTGFTVTWTVQEIDCITMLPIPGTEQSFVGDPYMTTFPWFVFENTKCYRITRNVSNCCYKECESYNYVLAEMPGGMMEGSAKPSGNNSGTLSGQELSIFPNPGDGMVTINANTSLKKANVTVFSTDGRIVYERVLEDAHHANINLSKLPNGVYTFKVALSNGKVINQNYIKQ